MWILRWAQVGKRVDELCWTWSSTLQIFLYIVSGTNIKGHHKENVLGKVLMLKRHFSQDCLLDKILGPYAANFRQRHNYWYYKASCDDKGDHHESGDDNLDGDDNENSDANLDGDDNGNSDANLDGDNNEHIDDNLVVDDTVEVDYNENGDDNQTTLCLLGWTLSLLRAPRIRRNVRVAATCHDHNDEYMQYAS